MANNDDNRPLKDFVAPKSNGIYLGYTVLNVQSNNFEVGPIKHAFIKYFNCLTHDDPNQHLALFEELCNTIKINGVEPKIIKFRTFPFSPGDKVRNWLRSLDANIIWT
jgi:hypothetical protein